MSDGNDTMAESLTKDSVECTPELSDPEVCIKTADSTETMKDQTCVLDEENKDIVKTDHLPEHLANVSLENEPSEDILESDFGNLSTTDPTPSAMELMEEENISSSRDEQREEARKNTYELENYSKNIMIIFNHELFFDAGSRTGTNLDAKALEDTFKQFGFEVTPHQDLEEKEIFEKLEAFATQNFDEYGCICVAILTHGADHGQLCAFDSLYSEKRVFKCFDEESNCSLRGKPIIFLIQACRGPFLAGCVQVPQGDVSSEDLISLDRADRNEGRYFLPTEANILIFHSCFFGRASARVETKGTWFIQTICEQILQHADDEHLEKIFRRVKHIIALEKVFQMPVTSSTLLRKLFLKRKKLVAQPESQVM